VRGRVEEVNWRAVHIRTVSGLRIIPNSELAGSGFTNLSRKTSHFNASTVVRFTTDDPPHRVIEVLCEVASDLPQWAEGGEPGAAPLTKARFEVDIPVNSPGDEYGTLAEFRTRLWYAARREGLHFDRDSETEYDTEERRLSLLEEFGPI